jgi:acetylornithine deacetylase/succinyl-diaminopimelate desuccinylase-like protein
VATPAIEFSRQNQARFLEELKALLRIPSVSTLPEHKTDVRRAAEVLAAELTRIGMENVRLIETGEEGSGHPLVYADHLHAPGKPTALLYGHYDVQPPDPLDEWLSPPFRTHRAQRQPLRPRRGRRQGPDVHARQSARIAAGRTGKLPLNVRVILEGEEEVGGEGIAAYRRLAARRSQGRLRPGLRHRNVRPRPAHALRRPARHDLHRNRSARRQDRPALRHVRRRGAQPLRRPQPDHRPAQGRIRPHPHPRHLRQHHPPSAEELAAWKSLPFDEEHYRETEVGSRELVGEPGYSVLERTWARPTLDVHGMPGGFIGAGAKTVIPAKATAKVSIRLVPGMTPAATFAAYRDFIQHLAPPGVDVDVRLIHSGEPCLIPVDNPYIRRPPKRCTKSGTRKPSSSAPAAPSPSSATSRGI